MIRLPDMKSIRKSSAFLILAVAGVLLAQAPGITRTVVTRKDVSVPGREASSRASRSRPAALPDAIRIPATRSATSSKAKARF